MKNDCTEHDISGTGHRGQPAEAGARNGVPDTRFDYLIRYWLDSCQSDGIGKKH